MEPLAIVPLGNRVRELAAAEARLERLYGAAARGALDVGTPAARDVDAALLDDLDVPRALAVAGNLLG